MVESVIFGPGQTHLVFCDIETRDGKNLTGLFSIVDILWLRLLRTILVHDEQISLRATVRRLEFTIW